MKKAREKRALKKSGMPAVLV
ncbi:hypothetical protein MES4922_90021 [Mesorhizobium ventifaucium]|uniref:Uncharacterized protein n=1 Tax=Mesorhizobium ventifaucium TaxID=666020 RepID=A0ABN8KEJ8_9HYPH|nr:hypothetical protein MES4922_90021 [Mesorhizobium ventifaucium]